MTTNDTSKNDNGEEKLIFEDATACLDRFINDLIDAIVDYMKNGVQAKIKQYKAER